MNKLLSILTALCFLTSVIGADIAYAIPASGADPESVGNSASLIPSNIGKVIESKTFENSRYTVINIQDLHCHVEAQKNIERMIERLQKDYKISAIFIEGGYGEIDAGIFGRVKDEKLRNNIIEGLFEKGRLTGAEYYYLKNEVKTPFYGLEDKDVHRANLDRLSKALSNSGSYKNRLSEIKAEIDYLKAKYFSRENEKFTATFENYKYGKMPIERYYALLNKYIEKLNRNDEKYNSLLSVSSGKYPVFGAYCELIKAGKKIDYNKASLEMQSLVNYLKDNLSYNEYNKLSLATAGFSNIEELSLRLPALSQKYGININPAGSLGQLISYMEASRNINPVEMLDEERRIAEDIRIAFSSSEEEIEISFLSDFYIYLEAFLNTKITASDYDFFEKEYPRFEKIYSKYAFKNTLSSLKEDIAFLRQYYGINKDRNLIFVKNIEKHLGKNAERGAVAIVITGGFHSEGLSKIFTQNGISYISLMPSVTQETKTAEESYNSFLAMGGNIFTSQALALTIASQAYKTEIVRMMADIAAEKLSELTYGLENIIELMEAISEALGGENIDIDFNSERTVLTLSEGFTVILKNENGKIVSQTMASEEALNDNKIKLAGLMSLMVEVFDLIEPLDHAVTSVFNPRVSEIVANIAAFAAKNNLITGDGLIFDIETNRNLPEKLGSFGLDELRKMPADIQQTVLKAYERDALINSEERISARVFLAAYSALGLDKAVLDAFIMPQEDSPSLFAAAAEPEAGKTEVIRAEPVKTQEAGGSLKEEALSLLGDQIERSMANIKSRLDIMETVPHEFVTDRFGREISVFDLTEDNAGEQKEKAKLFNGYRLLMAANRAAMSAVSAYDMDNALKYLGDMIEALGTMDSSVAARAKAAYEKIEDDWNANKRTDKHIRLSEWDENALEEISGIHTLINAVHQTGINKFSRLAHGGKEEPSFYLYSSLRTDSFGNSVGGLVRVINYSENEITPKVKQFISEVINIGLVYRINEFFVNDNMIIFNVTMGGRHSADIIVDLDSADDGIIAGLFDPAVAREPERAGRIFGFAAVLKDAGFNITDYQPAGGMQARYSARDIQNISSEYAEKFFLFMRFFVETADRDNEVFRFWQRGKDHPISAAARKITTADFQRDSENLKIKILQNYVKAIYRYEGNVYIFKEIQRARDLLKPIYSALGISWDRQYPEEIERYVAEGRAIVDFKTKKAKLNEYKPYENITEILSEFEEAKKERARELLLNGNAIDNLPYEDLFFRPEAVIGNAELKSGWLGLKDGRKLSVKAIVLRARNSIEAAYAEIVEANGDRREIGYAQLKELLESEGYKITERKPTADTLDQEVRRIIEVMKQEPESGAEKRLIVRGSAFAKGTGEWIKAAASYDIDGDLNGKILIRQEFAPADVESAGKAEGIIVMRGSEVMHSAIDYREKKNKTGILMPGRWQNGKLELSYTAVEYDAAAVVESRGYKVLKAKEGRLIIGEGEQLYINGATGEILASGSPDKAAAINDKYAETKTKLIESESGSLKRYALAKDLDIELAKAGIENAAAKELLSRARRDVINIAAERLSEINALAGKDSLNALEIERAARLTDEASYWKNYYGNKEIKEAVKTLSDKVRRAAKVKTGITETEKLSVNDASVYGAKSAGAGFLSSTVKKISAKTGVEIFAPKGMAVGKDIFETYMEGSIFSELLEELESAKKGKDIEKAKEAGRKIQKLIRETDNVKVKEEIIKALRLRDGIRYAVRSSGVGEDGKENAFAGMGKSYLNLSKAETAGYILKVWESFFSESAIAYMFENGLTVMPAVLVQEMVEDVEKSGVVLNGSIGAVFGLGEGIVSGRFTADIARVTDGKINYEKARGRTGKIVNDERGGTKETVLDKAERGARVLSEDEVLLLDLLRLELESELGYPADIEWSIDKTGNIHILQIRPVTGFVNDHEITYDTDTQSAKLELDFSKKIADRSGFSGWKRAVLVGIIEFLPSTFLLPLFPLPFVLMHYADRNGRVTLISDYEGQRDESFYLRMKGAKIINYGTWAFILAGTIAASSFGISVIWAVLAAVIYNVFVHASYNLHSKEKLQIGFTNNESQTVREAPGEAETLELNLPARIPDELGFTESELEILKEGGKKSVSVLSRKRAEIVRNMPDVREREEDVNNSQRKLALLDRYIADTVSPKNLRAIYSGREAAYLDILKNRTDADYLRSVVNDGKRNVEHRLFAVMLLKAGGLEGDFSGLEEQFIIKLKKNSFKVKNSFDLMSMLTGSQLLLERKDPFFGAIANAAIENGKYVNVYEKMTEAFYKNKKFGSHNANSRFLFNTADISDTIHELAHLALHYHLDKIGQSSDGLQLKTMDELFAFAAQELYAELIQKNKAFNRRYSSYRISIKDYTVWDRELYQLPHLNAHFFMVIINNFHAGAGIEGDWNVVLHTIVEYFDKYNQENFDDPKWKNFFKMYSDKIPDIVNDLQDYIDILELPALTVLNRALNKIGVSEEARAQITAVMELPLVMLAAYSPAFNETFIKWHRSKTAEQVRARERGMDGIRAAMDAAWEAAAQKAASRFSAVRSIQRLAFGISGMISANIKAHVEHNLANAKAKLALGEQLSLFDFDNEMPSVTNNDSDGEAEPFIAFVEEGRRSDGTSYYLATYSDDSIGEIDEDAYNSYLSERERAAERAYDDDNALAEAAEAEAEAERLKAAWKEARKKIMKAAYDTVKLPLNGEIKEILPNGEKIIFGKFFRDDVGICSAWKISSSGNIKGTVEEPFYMGRFDIKGKRTYDRKKFAAKVMRLAFSDGAKLELPALTVLNKALNKIGVSEETRAQITAVMELPLVMLAAYSPAFNETFIKWHRSKTAEQVRARERGMDGIRAAMDAAWEAAAQKAASRFSAVRSIQRLAFGIAGMISANIKAHVEHNLANSRAELNLFWNATDAFALDNETERELIRFYNAVFGTLTVDNHQMLLAFYVLNDLTSIDFALYPQIDFKFLSEKLAGKRTEFLKSLPEKDRKTFEIIREIRNPENKSTEKFDAFAGYIKEISQEYAFKYMPEDRVSINFDFLFFFAALGSLSFYEGDLLSNEVQDDFWRTSASAFKAAAKGKTLSFYLLRNVKHFADIFAGNAKNAELFAREYHVGVKKFSEIMKAFDGFYGLKPSYMFALQLKELAYLLNAVNNGDELLLKKMKEDAQQEIDKVENQPAKDFFTDLLDERTPEDASAEMLLMYDYIRRINEMRDKIPSIENGVEAIVYYRFFNHYFHTFAYHLKAMEERGEEWISFLRKFFSGRDIEYFAILKESHNKDFLTKYVKDKTNSLTLRLVAFMYLKANFDIDGKEEKELDAASLVREYKDNLGNFANARDYIQLRASLTGMHLLLAEELKLDKKAERKGVSGASVAFGEHDNIYQKISKAVIVGDPEKEKVAADSNFIFAKSYAIPEFIAHELAHNYLYLLVPYFGIEESPYKTIHEFFSFALECFVHYINPQPVKDVVEIVLGKNVDFALFDKYGDQQEHAVGRGFLNVMAYILRDTLQDRILYFRLAEATLRFIKDLDKTDNKRRNEIMASQSAMFTGFFESFINFLNENIKDGISAQRRELLFKEFTVKTTELNALLDERKALLAGRSADSGLIRKVDAGIAGIIPKHTETLLINVFSKSELEYYNLLESDEDVLMEKAADENLDVRYRLYALLRLRNGGNDETFDELADSFKRALENNEISVNNYFDVQAILTGMYELETKSARSQEAYEKIALTYLPAMDEPADIIDYFHGGFKQGLPGIAAENNDYGGTDAKLNLRETMIEDRDMDGNTASEADKERLRLLAIELTAQNSNKLNIRADEEETYRYIEKLNEITVKIADMLGLFSDKFLSGLFSDEELKYLRIVRYRGSNEKLLEIIKDSSADLYYRLFALMYYRAAGGAENFDDLRQLFESRLKDARALNNYELRAMLTGCMLLLSSKSQTIKDAQFVQIDDFGNIYLKISKAIMADRDDVQSASNMALVFADTSIEFLSHELGHNILEAYVKLSGAKDEFGEENFIVFLVIHELFAYMASGIIGAFKMFPEEQLERNKNEVHFKAQAIINNVLGAYRRVGADAAAKYIIEAVVKYFAENGQTRKVTTNTVYEILSIFGKLIRENFENVPDSSVEEALLSLYYDSGYKKAAMTEFSYAFNGKNPIFINIKQNSKSAGLAAGDRISIKKISGEEAQPVYHIDMPYGGVTLTSSSEPFDLGGSIRIVVDGETGILFISNYNASEKTVFEIEFFAKDDMINGKSQSGKGELELPALTVLNKALNKIGVSEETRAKITAVMELPLVMLAAYSPAFNETFIKWHRSKTAEQVRARERGMGEIRAAMDAAWEAAAQKAAGRFSAVRSIQRLAFGIAGMISANIKVHVEHNLANSDAALSLADGIKKNILHGFNRRLQIWSNSSIVKYLTYIDRPGLDAVNDLFKQEAPRLASGGDYKTLLAVYKRQLNDDSDKRFIDGFYEGEETSGYEKLKEYLKAGGSGVKIENKDGEDYIIFSENRGEVSLDTVLNIVFNGNRQAHRTKAMAALVNNGEYLSYDFKKVLFADDQQRMQALQWVIISLDASLSEKSLLLPAERRVAVFKEFIAADPKNLTQKEEKEIEWQSRIEHVLHYISKGLMTENVGRRYYESPIRFFSAEKYRQRDLLLEIDRLIRNDPDAVLFIKGYMNAELGNVRPSFDMTAAVDIDTVLSGFKISDALEDVIVRKTSPSEGNTDSKYICVGVSDGGLAVYVYETSGQIVNAFYIGDDAVPENAAANKKTVKKPRIKGIIPALDKEKEKAAVLRFLFVSEMEKCKRKIELYIRNGENAKIGAVIDEMRQTVLKFKKALVPEEFAVLVNYYENFLSRIESRRQINAVDEAVEIALESASLYFGGPALEENQRYAQELLGGEAGSSVTAEGIKEEIYKKLLEKMIGKIKRTLDSEFQNGGEKVKMAVEYAVQHIVDEDTLERLSSGERGDLNFKKEFVGVIVSALNAKPAGMQEDAFVSIVTDIADLQKKILEEIKKIDDLKKETFKKMANEIKADIHATKKYDLKNVMYHIERLVAMRIAEKMEIRGYKLREKLKTVITISHVNDVAFDTLLLPAVTTANAAPVTLTLEQTRKEIEKRGYTGLKAYLYTGYAELIKLLFMPAKNFAALHDNFDTFQYEKRVFRTRIVKTAVFVLTVAVSASIFMLLPPAAGLLPFIANSAIALFSAAFSLAFFGISAHAAHNFFENLAFKAKPMAFSLLSNKEMDGKLDDYLHSADINLGDDVDFITDAEKRKEIELLFKKPKLFKNGHETRLKVLKLIEAYFLKAIESNDIKAQDALVDMVYGIYDNTLDSMVLEEGLMFGFEKNGDTDIGRKKYELLEHFYKINAAFFKNVLDDQMIAYRVNNQKRIMRLFLSGDKKSRAEELSKELSGDVQDCLYMNEYLDILNSTPERYLRQKLTERQFSDLSEALQSASNIKYLLDDLSLFAIPKHISWMYIKTYGDKTVLKRILSDDFTIENKLHALLKLSSAEVNPFSAEASFLRIAKSVGDVKEEKIEIPEDIKTDLAEKSSKLLKDFAESGFSAPKDSYACALEAEMLFTAYAAVLHEKYPENDIVDFLKQLKFTFVRDGNVELIIERAGENKAEHFRIPIGDNAGKFINDIGTIVEEIYRKNAGDTADGGKFKIVSEGVLSLIKSVQKKPFSMFLILMSVFIMFPFFTSEAHAVAVASLYPHVEYADNAVNDIISLVNIDDGFKDGLYISAGAAQSSAAKIFAAAASLFTFFSLFFKLFVNSAFNFLNKKKDNKNVNINYVFTENRISAQDLEPFGLSAGGEDITVPLYMINAMPERAGYFNFKNTGVKINGKSVWVSSEAKALVIFAEGAELKDIEEAVKNDNKKIRLALADFIKKTTGVSLKGNLSLDWVNVDANAAKTSLSYDEDGRARIALSENDSLSPAEMAGYMTGVRQVRDADTQAAVQNIYYFLDNVKTASELDEVLGDFQKIGNGQIVLDYSVLKNSLSDSKTADFFAAARASGIKIIADLRGRDGSSLNVLRAAGFDGVLHEIESGRLSVYDFALASERNAKVVSNYENSEQLAAELAKSGDIKILNNSEIRAKIAYGDRSIIDRVRILKILKGSALLGALKKDKYTADFVRNAAYGFSEQAMSAFEKKDPAEFADLLRGGNIEAVKKYLGLPASHAVMIYLNNVYDNMEDKNEAAKVQAAFLEGILEKMLIAKTVAGSITDRDLEKTLGKALRIQTQSVEKGVSPVGADEFKEEIKRQTALQTAGESGNEYDRALSKNLQSALSLQVKSFAEEAFVNKDAASLAGIIELIPAIAEVRFNVDIDKGKNVQFDVRQLRNVLTAA